MKTTAQHSKQKSSTFILVLLLIAVIILCISIWIVFFKQNAPAIKQGDNVSQDSTVIEKNEDSISIPGYEGLTLKADSLIQDVALKNPPQNTCYFVIALYLDDGTLLWESDYIEPGSNSSPHCIDTGVTKGNLSKCHAKIFLF